MFGMVRENREFPLTLYCPFLLQKEVGSALGFPDSWRHLHLHSLQLYNYTIKLLAVFIVIEYVPRWILHR